MWINVGKQVINLDQVARIEVAKNYLYLYGRDQAGTRAGAENAVMVASLRCESEADAMVRYDKLVKLIAAIEV
jgi:hypothetical protein